MILEQIIRQKILEEGPISFSEFMAFALYDKDNGFYSHGGAGRRKDFITSPEVGPLFGKLIAKSIDRCWIICISPTTPEWRLWKDRLTLMTFYQADQGA